MNVARVLNAASPEPGGAFCGAELEVWQLTAAAATSASANVLLAHMDARPPQRIVFRLPQHLARHRRRVAFSEREELEQVRDRVAFGPAEVDVRNRARAI